MPEQRPYCKKCHSGAVYRDRDPFTHEVSIACMICGNRYPGGYGFCVSTESRMKEVNAMTKKACANCGRVKGIIRKGLCSVCARAAAAVTKGPHYPERRMDALIRVRGKLERGEIQTRNRERNGAR